MLLALAAALLLLACANVANLLLVRSVTRRREVALALVHGRQPLAAGPSTSGGNPPVGLAGGALAVAFTTWTAGTFAAFVPSSSLPLTLNGHANGTVILATMAISILSAMIFGILPALRASSLAPIAVLKEEAGTISGGIHKSRLSSSLVVAQISLSLLLLICAGLFIRSLQNAQQLDPGFDPNHVLLASYDLGGPVGYTKSSRLGLPPATAGQTRDSARRRIRGLGGFFAAQLYHPQRHVYPEGYVPQPHESMEISRAIVSPNYFRTMRTPLVAGREFTDQDGEKSQLVAIVNQEFCDRYWPGQDASAKGSTMPEWGSTSSG